MTQLQLIQGKFQTAEALDLISQLVNVKIKYHEDKIRGSEQEEDIKMRENRIKQLQKELAELRNRITADAPMVSIASGIHII
jgi:hypothetical protein